MSEAPSDPATALVLALRDQAENAKYTAASLYLWLHTLNAISVIFTAAQVILAALAGWKVLARQDEYFAAICGLGAAILLRALHVGDHAASGKPEGSAIAPSAILTPAGESAATAALAEAKSANALSAQIMFRIVKSPVVRSVE